MAASDEARRLLAKAPDRSRFSMASPPRRMAGCPHNTMSEIIFEVGEDEVDGGYWARALGHSIYTQGETWDDLRAMVKDAVECFFENAAERPKIIRLHFVRDEVLAA